MLRGRDRRIAENRDGGGSQKLIYLTSFKYILKTTMGNLRSKYRVILATICTACISQYLRVPEETVHPRL